MRISDADLTSFRAYLASEQHRVEGSPITLGPTFDTTVAIAEDLAQVRADLQLLTYERQLLGAARRLLDAICDPENTHQTDIEITMLRDDAGRLAQRIVDEIGHPVTDEPALGPEYREQIVELTSELTAARGELAAATSQLTAALQGWRVAVHGLHSGQLDRCQRDTCTNLQGVATTAAEMRTRAGA